MQMFGFYFLFQVFYFYEIDLSSNHRMDPERDLVLRCEESAKCYTTRDVKLYEDRRWLHHVT